VHWWRSEDVSCHEHRFDRMQYLRLLKKDECPPREGNMIERWPVAIRRGCDA
jgi:hypothetical protein